jgi:hypothetical protein
MPDSVSNSDIDAILRRQISSVAAQEKCGRNDPNEISAYLEGALSSKRVADFEQHLVNCAVCRRTVVELRALDDEGESPVTENVKDGVKNDETSNKIPAVGFVERLRRLLFGSGGNGYMWRPAAALVMILLIVGAPAVLFLRQSREAGHLTATPVGANKEAEQKPSADSTASGVTFSTSEGYVSTTTATPSPTPTAGKNAVVQSPEAAAKKDAGEPGVVAGQPTGSVNGPASPPPPPPPAPTPVIVAQSEDKVTTPPKALPPDKQQTNEELDKVQREAGVASTSNSAYGGTLTWNVTVTMTPVESRAALADLSIRRSDNTVSPDRGGGAAGRDAQPPASAKSAPATKKNEDADTRSRADDQKRKEAVAKKPADSPVPTVPYDKRVAQILKARFDKLMENKVRSGTGVTIRFRVGTDGSVISLRDGKLPESDIIKRSSNDVINTAVMQAIAAGKLPAFGDNEKDYSQIILVIKFDPIAN